MLIIPAIDILDGKCVRLHQGDYTQKTEYSTDPIAVAQQWESQGAKFLHLVDLDGAKEGKPVNLDIAINIAKSLSIPVELGGGIRNLNTIEKAISGGISRIVLGTVAYKDPKLVREACSLYPGKIIVGIDGRNGRVAVNGWTETTEISVIELAHQLSNSGVDTFIYTDISRDGAMKGPNFEGIADFASKTLSNVIASGGVSQLNDIAKLIELKCPNISGVIIGKALYDEKLNLQQALKLAGKQ